MLLAEDGFADYADQSVNKVLPEEEHERHNQKFDPSVSRSRDF